MPELNPYAFDGDPPTLYEVLQVAKDFGLVGEEQTLLTIVLAIVRGHLVVVTGPSRAGKDHVVDSAEQIFTSSNNIYHWPVDDSATAAYYNREEINQYPVHRFPDLARLPEHQEKILKAFGEGRDADRVKTDISQDDPTEEQIIECPRTVIAFIASDNENINLDDFPEIRNRALVVSVDASEEQTRAVNRRKARERAGQVSRNVPPMRRAEIQNYHDSIPVGDFIDSRENQVVNPAAVNIHEQEPIPEMFPEARQDFDRLLEFMETVTLYHYVDRMVVDDGRLTMLVSPVDIWEAMTVLGNKMVMSALNLTRQDRAILSVLEETTANLTNAEIQQTLRSHGFNITDRDVRRSLDSMRTKGYVRVFQSNPNEYTLNEFASVTQHDAGLDYSEVVEAAEESVYDIVSDEYADLYVERFCRGDGLITTHPITGEAVDITESNELQAQMDDGLDDVAEIIGADEESSDSEPDSDTQTQRRLM